LKRKRDEAKTPKDDAKLKEYLELMKAPSKPKTSLGDMNLVNPETIPVEDYKKPAETTTLADSDDEDLAKSRKVRKETHPPPPRLDVPISIAEITELPHNGDAGDVVTAADSSTTAHVVANEHVADQEEKSDMDWMRSRTSRLLGLVEDDDDSDHPQPVAIEVRGKAAAVHKAPVEALTDDPSDSRNAALQPEPSPEHIESDEAGEDEAALSSGRLFLRNITYSVTEAEIRELLEPEGQIEEVSLFSVFLYSSRAS